MQVLVLNPGSATLKFRLLDTAAPAGTPPLANGLVEQVEGDQTTAAAEQVLARCQGQRIDAVGCRVVHGGPRFNAPTRVTPDVLSAIRDLGRLAPLHNPVAAAVLEATLRLLPQVPLVAVFDTAFHRTIPDVAGLYALPLELSERLELHRYGFHGTSHRYVSQRVLARLGRAGGTRVVTCHLGNGASVCAVRDGRSIDTSMGLTPLEGLIMGTRSGDIDPGLMLHLLSTEKMTPQQVDDLLNHRSGLLGLGGHADVRQLQQAASAGDERARLALEAFAYRVRKYIGAYAAALEGVDAVAFTGGIGEHAVELRGLIAGRLGWLGARLDAGLNQQATGKEEMRISAEGSAVQLWVIPTDEELQIAHETVEVLATPAGSPGR
jgi:acetate kinase